MTRRALTCLIALGAFLTAGCGKKGPIQAPLVRIPQKVEEFKAFQRGDKIRLEWKLPATYPDGTVFSKPVEVEIWMAVEDPVQEPETAAAKPAPTDGKPPAQAQAPATSTTAAQPGATQTAPAQPAAIPAATPQTQAGQLPATSLVSPGELPLEAFREKAVLASSVKKDFAEAMPEPQGPASLPQSYEHPLDFGRLKSRYTFAVCVKDHREKYSEFSSRITLVPQILPLPPRGLKTTLSSDKILVSWEPPAANMDSSTPALVTGYDVYRSKGADPAQLLTSPPVKETAFEDRAFEFGAMYRYTVRAVAGEALPPVESGDSPAVEITPKDVFPPAPPTGLKTIAGQGFINLSWETNQEADLAGYRVWRRAASEEQFRPLTETPFLETNTSDRTVKPGIRYCYALTAVDKNGNESPQTPAVAETARRPRP
ncbi:MAG: hypothetical protein MUQ00_16090 [Candidatus Aminicenantes bacterium]|nr:hypothetical protein [Candidatus Aminicenantes bacterium]